MAEVEVTNVEEELRVEEELIIEDELIVEAELGAEDKLRVEEGTGPVGTGWQVGAGGAGPWQAPAHPMA